MIRTALAFGAVALLFVFAGMAAPPMRAAAAPPTTDLATALELDVTSMSPRVIDKQSRTLTVSVSLTNTSAHPITDLAARLHLSSPVTSNAMLKQTLTAGAPMDYELTPFRTVAERLAPGKRATFTLTADLRGGEGGLLLPEAGTYPLLINVNGTLAGGLEARLAASHLMLPVLSVPGTGDKAKRNTPPPTSILWPLTARPRVIANPLQGRLVLADDGLAEAMLPGGRLYALVQAAESVRDDEPLFSSMCFAIDPELIETAQAMTQGYRVQGAPDRDTRDGSAAAESWLTDVRALVEDACVVPTPYARADISLLAGSTPQLATLAASRDDVLTEVLGVRPLDGALAVEGELSEQALDAVGEAGKNLLIGGRSGDHPVEPTTVTTGDTEHTVVPSNGLVTLSLTRDVARNDSTTNATLASDQGDVATQNGFASIDFRARNGGTSPLLIAPPRQWAVPYHELVWFLQGIDKLASDGTLLPVPASDLFTASATSARRPAQQGSLTPEPSRTITDEIAQVDATVADLSEAMSEASTLKVDPADLLLPVREGLLRATSNALPHRPVLAQLAVADARFQLYDLLDDVSITEPDRTISLASGSSPIPVSIRNDLPVEITVRVMLSSTSGLRPGDISAQKLAPESSLNLRVPAEALRAGRFTVDVSLSTPGGLALGSPTRFQLASTEYGVFTVIVTAAAGGVLLLLAGRRIHRRIRSNGAGHG